MSLNETLIDGTLNGDGTLQLDEKPNLPPGRVKVVLRREAEIVLPEGDPFFEMLKGIWAIRAQAMLKPRTIEEVERQRRQLREESEQEVVEAGRLQDGGLFLTNDGQLTHCTAIPIEVQT